MSYARSGASIRHYLVKQFESVNKSMIRNTLVVVVSPVATPCSYAGGARYEYYVLRVTLRNVNLGSRLTFLRVFCCHF